MDAEGFRRKDNAEYVAAVRGYIGSPCRVTIVDQRTYSGIFSCLDKEGNILLQNATLLSTGAGPVMNRYLGTVIVESVHLVKMTATDTL